MKLEIDNTQAKVLKALIEGKSLSSQEKRELISLLPCLELHLENEFLKACGFDTSYGFYNTDVNYYKSKHPELFKKYFI